MYRVHTSPDLPASVSLHHHPHACHSECLKMQLHHPTCLQLLITPGIKSIPETPPTVLHSLCPWPSLIAIVTPLSFCRHSIRLRDLVYALNFFFTRTAVFLIIH